MDRVKFLLDEIQAKAKNLDTFEDRFIKNMVEQLHDTGRFSPIQRQLLENIYSRRVPQ